MFKQSEYDKVKKDKTELHKYALKIKANGVMTLYRPAVTVDYYYVDGLPMVHEVKKRDYRDNSIFNSGRTKESSEYFKMNKRQLDYLVKAKFMFQRDRDVFLRYSVARERIYNMLMLKMKECLGEFQLTVCKFGKLFKREFVLNECKRLGI